MYNKTTELKGTERVRERERRERGEREERERERERGEREREREMGKTVIVLQSPPQVLTMLLLAVVQSQCHSSSADDQQGTWKGEIRGGGKEQGKEGGEAK